MKLGRYESLDKTSVKDVFMDYIDALEVPIIDYVAIGVQDTIHRTSTSMMSRTEWQTIFRQLGLAARDPLRKASFTAKATIFSFDEIDCQDSCGQEVMRQRRRYEIENGLVLVRKHVGYNFLLTIATGYKNFSPYKFLIDNDTAIKRVFDDLIALVSPVTVAYQNHHLSHQICGAK